MKIEFKNVNFQYNKKADYALKNINLSLSSNEIVFILGETGSGKSTLVNHMNGLLFPSEGKVIVTISNNTYVLNNKLKNIKDVRRSVGLVFQQPEAQLFESNVLKEVMFGAINFGASDDGARNAAISALSLMGIDETYYEKSPFKLSGGEKRKVAIASVLACKPQILIFDEPTASLDNKTSREFMEVLQELRKQGHMIIVISHNEDLAYEYGDRIIIMNKGSIVYNGNAQDAFNDKELLSEAHIDIPFVARMKDKFNINNNSKTIKEVALSLRGESL